MKAKEKIILITGATSGIGRRCAVDLARAGYRVFATGRKTDLLAEVEKEAEGCALETVRLDVADSASVAAAKAEILRRTDGYGIDVLVNNAGFSVAGPLESVSQADLRKQFDTNVFGLIEVTQAFLPEMKSRRGGRIVNISSIAGRVSMPLQGVYNSSKYALEGLSDALRMELAPLGIRVVIVEPGVIRTDFEQRIIDEETKRRFDGASYNRLWDQYLALIRTAYKIAPGPEPVSRAVRRAIEAKRPSARYIAPVSNYLVLALKAAVPTALFDFVIKMAYGLSSKNIK